MKKLHPLIAIVMGSDSDLNIMEEAAKFLEEMHVPFEIKILSAHRTPEMVQEYVTKLKDRNVKIIIAGAGKAAHLPGVIAAYTTLPVIGVPIKAQTSLNGWESILSILEMPPGIPVATVGINAARNAAILAVQILSISDEKYAQNLTQYRINLKTKVVNANEKIKNMKYKYLIN